MTPIKLANLRKTFGSTVAVDSISLDVAPGALFFLLGPSGCGKTTLLRMLAGFTEPTAGTIHFGDKDITHTPAHQRRCGMVFQGYALWPHMTVAQNVGFGLQIRKVPKSKARQRIDKALDMVRMKSLANRKPNQLSGGQQQRRFALIQSKSPSPCVTGRPASSCSASVIGREITYWPEDQLARSIVRQRSPQKG